MLPGLDPTIMGWKQRDWYLPSTSLEVFDSAGNGGPSLWVDGRVVGAWAQTKDGTIHTHYFERVAAARRREIDQRINELKSWIGDTRFTVRFPGDIHARLLGTRTVPGPPLNDPSDVAAPIRWATRSTADDLAKPRGAYAGRMMARAGSAALVVLLLAGCQASGGTRSRRRPRELPRRRLAPPHLASVRAPPPVLHRRLIRCRSRLSSMPPGRRPMWRWPMLVGSWRRERPAGQTSVNQAARCGCSALRIAEPAMCCVRCGPAATCLASCRLTLWTLRVRVLTVGGRHPLRDPERYPLRTRSIRPVPEVTTMAAVGDIMLGRRVGDRHRDESRCAAEASRQAVGRC